ncbi:alpha/beta fold hydrolase [Naumannella huperziae]
MREDLTGTPIAAYQLSPSGPARGDVVLCHGTPWSSRVWLPVAQRLARDHRVWLWDMPGYGQSIMDPAYPVDLVRQGRRFAGLLSNWGVRRPHVVAHDIGGAVALGAHLLGGADFASLFLLDVVTLEPWGSPFFSLVAEHDDVFARLPPALHAALVVEYIAGASNHRLDAERTAELAAPWLTEAGRPAFYRQIAQLRPADTRPLAERLGEVRCRTGIGWGAEDPWIDVEQAFRLHAAIPGSTAPVIFDGLGHLAPMEDPDAVATAIRHWLSAQG